MNYYQKCLATPLGRLTLLASDRGLAAVLWENDRPQRVRLTPRIEATENPILEEAACQLTAYFSGQRRQFTVPLDFVGTEFQKQTWSALQTLGWGQTRSYSEIAAQTGRPRAVRATAAAIGRNPLSIIVPCHRVLGRSGALTGFAGGIKAKAWLLRLEGHTDYFE